MQTEGGGGREGAACEDLSIVPGNTCCYSEMMRVESNSKISTEVNVGGGGLGGKHK